MPDLLFDACGLDPARPVLAAVSGGADSLCLLDVLHEAGYRVIVAHFNHKLRPEADLEAAAVAGRARTLGLPFVTGSADVAAYAAAETMSLEEAARLLRYRFLFAAAREQEAQAVATGHTADDQVETVLMHFLRGAGLAGLKGMQPRTILPAFDPHIPLVRPLLGLWRSDTEASCREHGLEPVHDPSNADTAYFRNRLRHELIPGLESYNPRFKKALLRTARSLQGDFDLLVEVLEEEWKAVLAGSGPGWVAFDAARLQALSPAWQRNLLRRGAIQLRPGLADLDFAGLERAAAFAESGGPGKAELGAGLSLFREVERLYLAAIEADLPSAEWPQVEVGAQGLAPIPVNEGGDVKLGDSWVLSVEAIDGETARREAPGNGDPLTAWLDADRTAGRLTVRGRRAGDRFSPLGMGRQTVRLQEFYIKVKLPRRARAQWPVVCLGEEIVWVAGLRLAHPFRVTEKTERGLKLSLNKK
jgi:tRNA(Ile)-lysidine synthase